MTITPEESEAYTLAMSAQAAGLTLRSEPTISLAILANALRRHVEAEMRLEFDKDHKIERLWHGNNVCQFQSLCSDPRHNYTEDDWDRAADEALMGGKSDG